MVYFRQLIRKIKKLKFNYLKLCNFLIILHLFLHQIIFSIILFSDFSFFCCVPHRTYELTKFINSATLYLTDIKSIETFKKGYTDYCFFPASY